MTWSQLAWVRPGKSQLAGLAGSMIAVLLLVGTHDLSSARLAGAAVSGSVVAGAVAAVTLGLLVSSLRHRAVMQALGLRLPFWLAFRANVLGIIGGLLFFQVIGQTLARSAVLGRHGVEGAAVLLANLCERAVAVLCLLAGGLAGGLYLHGRIGIDPAQGGAPIVKLLLGLGVVAVTLLVLMPDLRNGLWTMGRGGLVTAIGGLLFHSVLVHATTLLAFVLVAHAMAPEVPLGQVAAASLLVMVAASLPISFAGWGVRELSAVHAYSLIGIGPEKALAVAIVVGLASLAAVLVLGLVAGLAPDTPRRATVESDLAAGLDARAWSKGLSTKLAMVAPPLVAALVFFQLQVPTLSGSLVTINLADPAAVLGGLAFVSLYRVRGGSVALWRTMRLPGLLATVTAVLGLGFIIGWWRFGFIEWAFYNRLLGWFILLGYLATGALGVAMFAGPARTRLLQVALASGVALAALDIGLTGLLLAGFRIGTVLPPGGIMGLAQNPNAFALQLLMLLVLVLLPGVLRETGDGRDLTRGVALIVILVALYLTRSRAGYISFAAVMVAALAWRWISWRAVAACGAAASAVVGALLVLPHLSASGPETAGEIARMVVSRLSVKIQEGGSDGERWGSIVNGLAMWWQSPFFGAGLGAFIVTAKAELGKALVIHNSGVWVLAELGLAGFAAVLGCARWIFASAWRDREHDALARALVLMCVGVAVFSLAHDIVYQRIVWLLLGVTLATGKLVPQQQAGEGTPPEVLVEQLRQVLPAKAQVLPAKAPVWPAQEGVPANETEPRKKAS